MGRREDNIEVFEDTTAFVDECEKLQNAIVATRKNQRLYLAADSIPEPVNRYGQQAKVIVSGKRTLEAASAYSDKKICILNFASATNPGGGVVHGSSAQEEALCRCSTLYFVLDTGELMRDFYQPHRRAGDSLYNDDLLYSPDVYAIKSDTSYPKRLPEEKWYKVNVITCAAPNLRDQPSNGYNSGDGNSKVKVTDKALLSIHEKRLRRILDVAVSEGVDTVILGAFGCGAFRNNPNVVAQAAQNVIKDYLKAFRNIEFAVYCRSDDDRNYRTFKRMLHS